MKNRFRSGMAVFVMSSLMLAGCSSNVGETLEPSVTETQTAEAETDAEPSGELSEEAGSQDEASGKEEAEEAKEETGTAEGEAQSPEPSSNEDVEKAIEAYVSVIKEKEADPQYPFLGYTLIHLDEDEIPELAIAYGGSHADGVGFYGFDGSAANEICFTGSLGTAYYEKGSGLVYGWYTGQGETSYNIGIIKDGKLAERILPVISIIYDDNFEETGYKYQLDGENEMKDISREEFEEILAPYDPEKRQYKELECNKLNEAKKSTDIAQALRDSLTEEDNLPQPDMEFYHKNIISETSDAD